MTHPRLVALLGIAFLSAAPAGLVFSQVPPIAQPAGPRIVKIDKINANKIPTPEYQVDGAQIKGGRTRSWMQVVTKYQTAPDWIDEINFKYFALVKNKKAGAGEPPYLCFQGDVDYVNVEKGSHESDIYIHPSTLSRFGDVERVAVQIFVRGQLVAMETLPASNVRWWEQVAPQPGYVLNRMETPFAMINFDNYEAIKGASRR